ncbi:methyltransferase domain-containing protein [Nocardioides sp. zg-1308]|uniref:class I SAM-dependent methyltransferase n=1 Tax=Nocardioides sp. zg-1308 TaxID=2736253 RepID=UPI001555ED50|nr:methyltransferase domain-containing protein [Nocardioides sp. zg-1308]NPD03130.1 methyltransferase domain-containing protein [Nocardioides sp. zg-1308]
MDDTAAAIVATRRQHILDGTDVTQGRSLEIGPLATPILTRDMGDVRYVDVVDLAGLREHYGTDATVVTEDIVEVDFWLTREDGSVSTLAEAVAPDGPYHHVVASHVIEHVPDMVRWLQDVADVLVDGGSLLLAVPDRRFCFDALRSPATVGQVLQAHHDGDRIPSVRAVYDYARTSVEFPTAAAWAGAWPPEQRTAPLDRARTMVAQQQQGLYVDCHVWPTSPVGLADLLADLVELGLVDFGVERVTATQRGHHEFYVTLRRFHRARDRDVQAAEAVAALGGLRADLPDEDRTWPHQVREAELLEQQQVLERRLARAEARLATATAARDRAREQRDRARRDRRRARASARELAALVEPQRTRPAVRLVGGVRRRLGRLRPGRG